MTNRLFVRLGACVCLAAIVGGGTVAPAAETAAGTAKGAVSEPLTIDRAIALALAHNPRVSAGEASIRAAAGRERQAAALPNPELEAGVEDIGTGGLGNGLDAVIYSVRVGQTVELGGKRRARRRMAGLDREIATWDAAAVKADVVAAVRERFIDLLAAEARLRTLQETHELARRIRDTVAENVRSGKVSPMALIKADVELTGAEIERQRAERRLNAARTYLGALWGGTADECAALTAAGDLTQLPELPALDDLLGRLGHAPEWVRGDRSEALAAATVDSERTARIPDVTLTVGVSHEREMGEEFVEFGVSLPLPLFDRNRGNIEAALAEAEKTRQEVRGERLALNAELMHGWQLARAALDEAQALRDIMLPGARKAFESAQEAYRGGKADYLDLLDAQKTLFDTEMRVIEALAEAHASLVVVKRLTTGESPTAEWTTAEGN
jgi:cobalt-zinc-cadmium efflux system outer membrane protein